MPLPFTTDQFLGVFAAYNRAVWPAPLALYALGLALVLVGYGAPARGSRFIPLGLAFLWAWMGGVYHLLFFRRINPAAAVFGGAFLLQAALFTVWGFTHGRGTVGKVRGAGGWLGGILLAYALVVYPLLGWSLGHRYPSSPTFGAPCPTTIATLGLLVWVSPSPPWWLLIVPLAWVLVGGSAAFSLGIREDLGLLAAGVAAGAWLWYRSRRGPSTGTPSLLLGKIFALTLILCWVAPATGASAMTGPAAAQQPTADLTQPRSQVDSMVARFYERRGRRFAWSDSGVVSPQARGVLDALARAAEEGLDPEDYPVAAIDSLLRRGGGAPNSLWRLDSLLTLAFFAYGTVRRRRGISFGREPPAQEGDRTAARTGPEQGIGGHAGSAQLSVLQSRFNARTRTGDVSENGFSAPCYAVVNANTIS